MKIIDRFFIFVLVSILFTVLAISIISLVSSQVEIGAGEQSGVLLGDDDDDDDGGGNVTEAEVETLITNLAWRLDGTNDPPSASWSMGGFGFTGVNQIVFDDSNSISDSPFTLKLNSQILNINADTTNFGAGLGDVSNSYQGINTGVMVWKSTKQFFDFQAGMNIDYNLTVLGNISADGLIFGNGSQLSEVCKSDGTDCMSSGSFDENGNYTLNGTWDFREGLEISPSGKNITYSTPGANCIFWEQGIGDTSICSISNVIDISAVNVRFPKSLKLQVGSTSSGPTNTYGLEALSSGNDDFFYFIPNNAEWGITYPIGFTLRDGHQGFLFDVANTRQMLNITWNNWDCVISSDCDFKITTRGDLQLNQASGYFGNVTTNTDFCLSDGTCLGGVEGKFANQTTFSFGRENDSVVTGSWIDDPMLLMNLGAGINYSFEFDMLVDNTNDGIEFNVTFSGTGDLNYGWHYQYGNINDAGLCNQCASFGNVVTLSDGIMKASGTVYNITSAGTLGISYIENVHVLSDTLIKSGSNLEVNILEEI
jgi:hypothetical protein